MTAPLPTLAQAQRILDDAAAWPHQQRAVEFVSAGWANGHPGALLAYDMGTGKSRVVVDLVTGHELRRVLVLCPRSVLTVWPEQFRRWAAEWSGVVEVPTGTVAQRTTVARAVLGEVYDLPVALVLNYEAAWREPLASLLMRGPWDLLVMDESHRIKAPGGVASRFCSRLADRVPRRLALTGTPLAHGPGDVYAQYRALDKRVFGVSYARFRATYATPGGYMGHEWTWNRNQADLAARMATIALQVRAADVLDLPEAMDVTRECVLEPEARRVYDELDAEMIADVQGGTVTAANALVRLLRLSQIAGGHLRDDDGTDHAVSAAKADLLRDVLDDLDEPVVVFCRFRADLDAVHAAAAQLHRDCLELSGRRNDLAAWQRGEAPVLAVQVQAGGVGIDLTRARVAVYYSLGFSLGDYLQSRARLHRPGQTRSVLYVHLVASGTVDVTIYRALAARQDVVEAVLAQMRGAGLPE